MDNDNEKRKQKKKYTKWNELRLACGVFIVWLGAKEINKKGEDGKDRLHGTLHHNVLLRFYRFKNVKIWVHSLQIK